MHIDPGDSIHIVVFRQSMTIGHSGDGRLESLDGRKRLENGRTPTGKAVASYIVNTCVCACGSVHRRIERKIRLPIERRREDGWFDPIAM